jgi:hypothetical protein
MGLTTPDGDFLLAGRSRTYVTLLLSGLSPE